MPLKSDFIFRGNNAAILFLQNSEKHCLAWFLTTVFTFLNIKYGETYKLYFKSSGKQDFLGSEVFAFFQWEGPANLGNFWLLALVSTSYVKKLPYCVYPQIICMPEIINKETKLSISRVLTTVKNSAENSIFPIWPIIELPNLRLPNT